MPNTHPSGVEAYSVEELTEWSPDAGEEFTRIYTGSRSDVYAKYTAEKAVAGLSTGAASISFRHQNGRGVCVAHRAPDAKTVEELYAIDMIRDIRTHSYFSSLTNAEIVAVTQAADKYQDAASGWSALQKQLHYHLVHGMDSYYEVNFVLRRAVTGARTKEVRASFADLNTVVTPPTLSADMNKLLDSLPSGEWLKKPPQATYLGRGAWQIDQSWQWAPKWSKMYGGTWGL